MWPTSCLEGDVATLACIPALIKNIITAALTFAGVIALVLLIYAGAMYILSKGDPQKVESAKKTFTWAIVGLLIILLSFFIVGMISYLTGVDQIQNPSL